MNSDDRLTRTQRTKANRRPVMIPADTDDQPTDDDIAEAIREYARRRYADTQTQQRIPRN